MKLKHIALCILLFVSCNNFDNNESELSILLNTDKKNERVISIMEESQQYRQEKEVVTLDYIPKIEENEGEKPKRIVPKNDKKQKSLFEF